MVFDPARKGSTNGTSADGSVETDQDSQTLGFSIFKGANEKTRKAVRLISVFAIFCAIPLALGVYFYTANTEKDTFEVQFEEFGLKVLESIGSTLENSFGALDNLGVALVASVHSQNQTFPMFRVPEFSTHVAKTLSLSRAKVLVTCPLVTSETYDEWTNWTAQEGITWVDETVALLKTDPNYFGPIIEDYSTLDVLYTGSGPIEKGEK